MTYTTLKNTTKKAQSIIESYNRATASSVFEVYNTCSYYKQRAEEEIKADMQQNCGRGYRVISYNCNFFTCGYMGIYEAENGKKYKALYYFTHCNNIVIPLEEIEEAQPKEAQPESAEITDEYLKDYERRYNNLSDGVKERLAKSGVVVHSKEEAESLMQLSELFSLFI